MSSPVSDRPASKILDLEVKDARIIFTPSWEDLQEEVGRENLRFPKEIILLGGAPGAGKGTQTQFINETRGLTCPPIVISELLTTPEMEKLKAQGVMVGDKEVVSLLLRKLLEPTYRDGVVLDGFPRTPVQVECLKLLVEKINELHDQFADTPLAIHFRRPTIHAMVLFVSESTSIARQLGRGREIAEHNKKVAETGDRHADRVTRDGSLRRSGAPALSGVQGADVGGADVAAAALSLPLHQRRRPDRGGAGEHPQGAQVSELAGAGPAHIRTGARAATCRGARRPRPAGAGQAAR